MAIWTIPEDKVIDYSPNGDDIDSFSQKVKYCLEEIFTSLQYLHANGARAGLPEENTEPYAISINTLDNGIYMRNGANDGWILLGYMDEYFGLTPEKLHAIRNGGGVEKLQLGLEGNLPQTGNETNDLYFAIDKKRIWIWTGSTWDKFLSLNFADTLNYEAKCVSRDELTKFGGISGAGKILQLNANGKANVDITGSPDMLEGYLIDTQDLRDGHTLTFDADKRKFVNQPNYNLPLNLVDPKDGQTLVYRNAIKSFRNESVALGGSGTAVGAGGTLEIRRGTDLVAEYNGANDATVNIGNQWLIFRREGETAEYASYNGMSEAEVILPANKFQKLTFIQGGSTVTEYDGTESAVVNFTNHTLSFRNNNGTVAEYDGTSPVIVDMPNDMADLKITQGGKSIVYNGKTSQNIDLTQGHLYFQSGGSTVADYDGSGNVTVNLPDPNKTLTITRGSATVATYDGTASISVDIANTNKKLTLKKGTTTVTYDGSAAANMNLDLPTLTLTRGSGSTELGTYDGTEEKTIDITNRTLTFIKGATSTTYNGSAPVSIDVTPIDISSVTSQYLSDLMHLKRLTLLRYCKENANETSYFLLDRAFAERFGTNKTTTIVDTSATTWTLSSAGYELDGVTRTGKLVTGFISPSHDFSRVLLILVAHESFKQTIKAEIALSTTMNHWFDGTKFTVGEKFFDMTRATQPTNVNQWFGSSDNVIQYSYEMPTTSAGMPLYAKIRLSLESTALQVNGRYLAAMACMFDE